MIKRWKMNRRDAWRRLPHSHTIAWCNMKFAYSNFAGAEWCVVLLLYKFAADRLHNLLCTMCVYIIITLSMILTSNTCVFDNQLRCEYYIAEVNIPVRYGTKTCQIGRSVHYPGVAINYADMQRWILRVKKQTRLHWPHYSEKRLLSYFI